MSLSLSFPSSDFIILVIGLIIISIFYELASFGYIYSENNKYSFKYIYLISLIFGIIVYLIKIPLFYYYGLDNTLLMYTLYLIVVSITVILYSYFILKEKVYTHTFIIFLIIICLFVLNNYLTSLYK
jgi:hypothetical protein